MKGDPMARFVRVCSVGEVPPGTVKSARLEIGEIVIFNLNGSFHAAKDSCPHEGAPLSCGTLEGDHIICCWHGATFHVPTGKTTAPPAGEKMGPPVDRGLTRYEVRVAGADLEIDIGGE